MPADTSPALPSRVATLADAEAVERAARVVSTRHAEIDTVWHVWNEPPAGPPGKPLVLLHGGSGGWPHWVRNIAGLARAGYTLYVPDMPGFGLSDALLAGGDADSLPPFIEQGLQELLGGQSCRFVCFSFGSMVGTFLAADIPARVERLVLVGAPALGTGQVHRLPLRAWNHLPAGEQRDAIIRSNLLMLMVAREETLDETATTLLTTNMLRDRMARRRLALTDAVLRTLPRVRCPVYGVWGREDALYKGRTEVIEAALRQAPHFKSLAFVEGAGHWVQYEDAAGFEEKLLPMLA